MIQYEEFNENNFEAYCKKQIPYSIIKATKKFDAEAVEIVFRHFEGYMASQCVCCCTDE